VLEGIADEVGDRLEQPAGVGLEQRLRGDLQPDGPVRVDLLQLGDGLPAQVGGRETPSPMPWRMRTRSRRSRMRFAIRAALRVMRSTAVVWRSSRCPWRRSPVADMRIAESGVRRS
jgi:hypothetical protein